MSVRYHKGKFPPAGLDYEVLLPALARATDSLARYDSYLGIIPNPEIFLTPMLTQEAVVSSRIEGTQATANDVYEYEAGKTDVEPARESDILEVINYRKAMLNAQEMLKALPLSGRVLKATHEIMLKDVRGWNKSPGRYRVDQNWIGYRGSKIEDARYIPAAPDDLESAMCQWEKYVNDDSVQGLIKTAIAHAEFESIHPFADGNGRIGRMIIPLMLWKAGLLSQPSFYLSAFFDKRNTDYTDKLLDISKSGKWNEWCLFFFEAIDEQARGNRKKAEAVFNLNSKLQAFLLERSGSSASRSVVDRLFQSAVFSVPRFLEIPGVNQQTARRLLNILKAEGVVVELYPSSGRRPAICCFPGLIEITDEIDLRGELNR